ncbi:unnamed protein product [Rotaria sordida]|uniref:Uncharacterized protein n=1 Tax=Rotaria sordida TaxID=392033 RepID=A0A813U5H5_9BILA|nr:unnamed protein product [Rotaria sordida]CAF0818028.1 unnamed protein product [Rotaria sordida]CAF0831972.1 unnamed protein product [Rotaria sordida]CAF0888883.1 unnamed protein product [Rotaria sordida]
MIFGTFAKTGSRLFTRYELTNSVMNKERISFSAAVLMSLVGVGLSVFSTNKMLLASSSTRSMLTKSQ